MNRRCGFTAFRDFSASSRLRPVVEAITALPYDKRPAPASPGARPAYKGANPISHIWASKCIELMSTSSGSSR